MCRDLQTQLCCLAELFVCLMHKMCDGMLRSTLRVVLWVRVTQVTQHPTSVYFLGIHGATPKVDKLFHRASSGTGGMWRQIVWIWKCITLSVLQRGPLDLIFYSSDCCQCHWRSLLLQCLMETVLLIWKCFSLEAIKTGPRWDRRDWAAALVNNTGCPRIGTKGSLWLIFLAGCLDWVHAVFPHSTTLTFQVLPLLCFSKLFVVWHGCITWDFFVSCCVLVLPLVWLDTSKTKIS